MGQLGVQRNEGKYVSLDLRTTTREVGQAADCTARDDGRGDGGRDVGKTAGVIKGYGWHARLADSGRLGLGPMVSSRASSGPRPMFGECRSSVVRDPAGQRGI